MISKDSVHQTSHQLNQTTKLGAAFIRYRLDGTHLDEVQPRLDWRWGTARSVLPDLG